ncbi:hypothetical protein CS022_11075 [Veronia nyctiphanis]|uniref:Uncharacterized protein n=1 Tax=Veronia nyctiphanis TaxID=1278244 RepID=A0A4Q0YRL9_9GAMM|nr:hypothetical protein [Veronia nyctiphanis]RXJ73263.1 hypothetical protein CS022_11075 [Veronia nyctiphanis]
MKQLLPLLVVSAVITGAGCKSVLPSGQPDSDYQATLPEKLSKQLMTLNNEPAQSFRGKTLNFHFDESKGLLTLVHRARGNRWQWQLSKEEANLQTKEFACNTYINAVRAGLGVRQWFTGAGGFATDTFSYKDCN